MKRTELRRSTKPIGEKRRQAVQWERHQATSLEGVVGERPGLFDLHRVDWLHIETPQRDKGTLKSGSPDYFILGENWGAWLEIKARNLENNRLGSMQANQYAFHAKLQRAGYEVWTAWLPDDLDKVNDWLRSKTGVICSIDGLLPAQRERAL
jgi:hypothetical protein